MKTVIPILLVFSIFSCHLFDEKSELERMEEEIGDIKPEIPSTAFEYPEVTLPEGFQILGISITDTLTSQYYDISCLQSTSLEMQKFNREIRNVLIDYTTLTKAHLDTVLLFYTIELPYPNTFHCSIHPVDIFVHEDLISVTYLIDSYLTGSNRHNHDWLSFNYDLRSNKIIEFDDVFDIKNATDAANFREYLFMEDINACIEFDFLDNSTDFSFSQDGIYLNPSGWTCYYRRPFISKENLQFVKTNVKQIFK